MVEVEELNKNHDRRPQRLDVAVNRDALLANQKRKTQLFCECKSCFSRSSNADKNATCCPQKGRRGSY
jgi:hypothetical protein